MDGREGGETWGESEQRQRENAAMPSVAMFVCFLSQASSGLRGRRQPALHTFPHCRAAHHLSVTSAVCVWSRLCHAHSLLPSSDVSVQVAMACWHLHERKMLSDRCIVMLKKIIYVFLFFFFPPPPPSPSSLRALYQHNDA